MKICQKCNSEVDRIFIVQGENTIVFVVEDESQCEFWAHKELNALKGKPEFGDRSGKVEGGTLLKS